MADASNSSGAALGTTKPPAKQTPKSQAKPGASPQVSVKTPFPMARLKLFAAILWLTFSIALAVWWMIFGLSQIDQISKLAGAAPLGVAREIARQHRMLLSEGMTLILLLLGGGLALLYHVRVETKRNLRMKEFFAAFTHDLKTSLASLRLQTESLEEDMRETGHERLMRRLVKDTVRLEMQLENSLLLASPNDGAKFLIEPIRLNEFLMQLVHNWPDLEIEIDGDATILADHRALESVCKNLMQNSVAHGRATKLMIKIERTGSHGVVRFLDNGRGFSGDLKNLGKIFERHGSSSGSGLGLYLAKKLTRRLSGGLHFIAVSEGFSVELVLPEAR